MKGIKLPPTPAEIATLAARFREQESCPGGQDLKFWDRAERALEGHRPVGRMTLAEGLREIEDRLCGLAENERAAWLNTLRCGLDDLALRVVVFGEFNRGKSTLINALLGREVLPASLVPTTGHLIHLLAGGPGGADEAHIYFLDGRVEQCALDALEDCVVLNEQGQAREDVAQVEVTVCGCPLLDAGVVLVDTPGLNDHATQTARAKSAIARADLVLLVLDARALLTESERELAVDWLGRALGKPVVPLVNFMNILPEGERDKVRRRLDGWSRGTVQEELGRPWFEVNALGALDHALREGPPTADHFSALRDGLAGLAGERRRQLQRRSRRGQLLAEVREVRARNTEVLGRLREDAARVEADRNERRDLLRELCRRFDVDARGGRGHLTTFVQARLREDADKLATALRGLTKAELESKASTLYQEKLSRAAKVLDQRADKALKGLVQEGCEASSGRGFLHQAEPMTVCERMILNARVAVGELPMISASEGAVGGGAVVGGAIGTFLIPVPVLGTLVGGFVGGLLASFFGETEPDYGAAYAVKVRELWESAADQMRTILTEQFDARCVQLRRQVEAQLEASEAVGAQSLERERLQRESLETLLERIEGVLASSARCTTHKED